MNPGTTAAGAPDDPPRPEAAAGFPCPEFFTHEGTLTMSSFRVAALFAPHRRAALPRALAAACLGLVFLSPLAAFGDDKLQYNRDVRPILLDTCFACHGPDSAARKAELRLDQREAAIEASAIAPGKPDESEMIRRILSDDPDEMMPPPSTKKSLTKAQKDVLVRWVREGAEYQPHWSFIPPVRPEPPEVKNGAWVRTPIDRFVLARLEKEGLEPAPEADRRTLARRLSLDLTGLPPAPELVEAFVNDSSPDAYMQLVDKLLDTEQWGEHRARYWLDYARYADTHGIHFDNFREMWTYRDWVINAFNRNMPFDQFTIENLAGDLLPNHTQSQLIGSGFNRCNMTTNEGGIIDEEYLVLYARDRVETTSQVWMGLTAGCAVCHSHKFDPLTQHEFYELAAFFNNTTQGARDGNVKDTPPIITVPMQEDQARWKELGPAIAEAQKNVEERRAAARADFDKWLAGAGPEKLKEAAPSEGLHFAAGLEGPRDGGAQVVVEGQERVVPLTAEVKWQAGPAATTQALELQGAACELADVGDFDARQPFSCAAWVKLHANDAHGAICARMDNASGYRGWDLWVQQRRVGMHIINAWPNNALKVVAKPQVKANEWVHVAVTYDGSGKAAGIKVYHNGQPQQTNVESDQLDGDTRTAVPFKIGQRNSGDPINGAAVQDLRLYKRALGPGEVETLARLAGFSAVLAKESKDRTEEEVNGLYAWWLGRFDAPFQELQAKAAQLERERDDIKARGTIAHVMQEKDAEAMAYVLFRGEYDKRRDPVKPGTPAALPPFPDDAPRNRLGFAQWLLRDDHPLTSRVTVNRYWQEVFGAGLVRTTGDFGVAGELPSHPELLDWLAVEFRESGWDVKRLFKLIVTSAAYRQSAAATPAKIERDPSNRLLSRGPRFRMDAEMIRDGALASSGLLVRQIGGPSVKPYQPPGVWEAIAMDVSNTRSYQRDTGSKLYRRSLYTFWKRMAPPASLDIFNAPNREFCVVRRERTNTPLQALVTLNDEQFVEAARHLAQLAIKDGGDSFDARLKVIGLRLIAREFRPDESAVIRLSLNRLTAFYDDHPDDVKKLLEYGESKPDPEIRPAELAAWTMLSNELMNLDEVLNKP